jgi:16S rRNA (uracil1498-N3)-methyltransferase
VATPRIYTPQNLATGEEQQLEETASRHLAGALRMKSGDRLSLFNGEGGEFNAEIVSITRKSVQVRICEYRDHGAESPLTTHLGIAISRGDRMDWVVQKATELGVSTLTPLFSTRTEVKLSTDRAQRKLGHWRAIAISACEQTGRNTLPEILGIEKLETWCESVAAERKFVLHHRSNKTSGSDAAPTSVALLIGPEGGLDETELELASGHGFDHLALGPRVMRTETAPLAALAILQSRWGDIHLP